jgi:hypothetical protein
MRVGFIGLGMMGKGMVAMPKRISAHSGDRGMRTSRAPVMSGAWPAIGGAATTAYGSR